MLLFGDPRRIYRWHVGIPMMEQMGPQCSIRVHPRAVPFMSKNVRIENFFHFMLDKTLNSCDNVYRTVRKGTNLES